jgi:GntR family transcriptional repressor for pyruvate dehydrogenase complex
MSDDIKAADRRRRPERDGPGLPKVSRDPVSTEVSRRLLTYLLSGQVKIGERLPSERQLAEQLDVGRNAIRDGLRPLTLLGILESRAGSGTYVKGHTSDLLPEVIEWGLLLGEPSVQHLLETRLYVESGLAKLAAERRSASSLDALRAAGRKMATAAAQERHDKFFDADLAFHLAIADAAQNDVLAGILRSTRTLIEVWIRRSLPGAALEPLYGEHQAILDAIERQDVQVAGDAMEEHLRAAMGRLFAALETERTTET